MQEPVIANATKTSGRHVLDKQPQELRTTDSSCATFFTITLTIAECHRLSIINNQLQVKVSQEKWLPCNFPTSGSAEVAENNDADVCVA